MKACFCLIMISLAMAAVQSPQEEVTNTGRGCIEKPHFGDTHTQHCAAPGPSMTVSDPELLSMDGEQGFGIRTEDGQEELKKVLLAEAEVARLNNKSYTDLDPRLIARLVQYKLMVLTEEEAEKAPGPWKSWGKVKVLCNPSRFSSLTSSRSSLGDSPDSVTLRL
ncbi:uncharacterized protein LOC144167506 [Haemaphysalis longicornis]